MTYRDPIHRLRPVSKLTTTARTLSAVRFQTTQMTMPALSPTMTEGGVGSWKKKEGESFEAGDVLVEIVSSEIPVDREFATRMSSDYWKFVITVFPLGLGHCYDGPPSVTCRSFAPPVRLRVVTTAQSLMSGNGQGVHRGRGAG